MAKIVFQANGSNWNLRFGRVHWRVGVADVLCALEDAEGERCEEVARCKQTSSRSESEASVATQEVIHFLQLWNSVLNEDSFLLELGEDDVVLLACVLWHQLLDDLEDGAPGVVFGLAVVDVWNWVATVRNFQLVRFQALNQTRNLLFVTESDFSDVLASLTISLISEAWMVHVEIWLVLGHQMVAVVQFRRVLWEPWSSDAHVVLGQQRNSTE